MAETLQTWVGPLIQQECEQVAAWCHGTNGNINSLGHGAYTRTLTGIMTTFNEPKTLQIDRFDNTVGRHITEALLSDSETFIRAVFDKASTASHRRQTGNSFKEGTEGGFIEIKRYTLSLTTCSGKLRRAIVTVHDFTYLGEVGANIVGQPKSVEERKELCECLDRLGSILSRTGISRFPSPVHSQAGDSQIDSQVLGISTQYLPSAELVSETVRPPTKPPKTTADLVHLLGSKSGNPLKPLGETLPLESTRTETRASVQHVLQYPVSAKHSRISPAGNSAILPGSAMSRQTVVSHKSTTISITPEVPTSGSDKGTSQEIRSVKKSIGEPTNGNGKEDSTRPQIEKGHQDCPWGEQSRIPQRELKIPKDQLEILNQNFSWMRSANDLESSSSRIPPTILRAVDQSIDNQVNNVHTELAEKLNTAATTLKIPAQRASTSTPDPSDSEDGDATDWSVSPDRRTKKLVNLDEEEILEAKIDDDDSLDDTQGEDEMRYAEVFSMFQKLPEEIYAPPDERSSTDPMVEPHEEPLKKNRPITPKARSVSYTSDNNNEVDVDDMELEVPHAIDDVDIDMPDILSSSPPSLEENARTTVQVERTPRIRASAVPISSQDSNFRLRKTGYAEAVSYSVEPVPGTLESGVLESNGGLSTSPRGLDIFNDLEHMDDEHFMLDNHLQPECGSTPIASVAKGRSKTCRSDAHGADSSGESKKIVGEEFERDLRATSEATSSANSKSASSSKSSKPPAKRHRLTMEPNLEFSATSQETMDTKDLVNANRRNFIKNLGENNSRFTDTSKAVSEHPRLSSQTMPNLAPQTSQVQQSAIAISPVSAAVISSPDRHVSFNQPSGASEPMPTQKISSISKNLTSKIVPQNEASNSEESANEIEPSPKESIFQRYIAVYPSYEGSLRAFIRCAAYLKWLQETKSDPHRSVYDDIIRVFASIEYSDHIKEMKEKGKQPMPLLAFYNDSVDTPIYNERIVLPTDLPEVLKLDPAEAAKVAKAFAEGKSRSLNASRTTSASSVRIPDRESVGGLHLPSRIHEPESEPAQTRQPFFETESQLQSKVRPHSPTPLHRGRVNQGVSEATHEDTGLMFMSDDYDDIDVGSATTRPPKKRNLPCPSSSMGDVENPPPASLVTRKENWSAASSNRLAQPKTTDSRKSPVLGVKLTPRSSIQKFGASRPIPTLSAVHPNASSRSSFSPLTSKPNPSRRYTMVPLNESLKGEFGDRRAAKRPRHSMPAHVSYERIEPATPQEVEFAKLAREYVPKRSLGGVSVAGTPSSSATSRRKRYTEPETQDWGF